MQTNPEQQQIVRQFQAMRSECNELVQKIGELEIEQNEHRLVIDAVSGLDAGRRCYRLVGGVLVERTVGEVLPAVRKNLEGIEQILKTLNASLLQKDKALNEFKVQHKIRVMGEDEDEAPAPQAKSSSSSSSGVLV
ncbi:prefoldin subunit 2, putative [Acanthamoeba castellanii str. Neff]|uniref:Prefoldin subunit 2, putative n=1 Tax=Acanthamoeba castellanii (strain ATCC 30010 / Neff) TaxID=1257118 RepID=L8GFE5_ACACF|nr:prefoldin subunit 2, putative [Acanthamoeba castellanii str. Neff]ELR10901.1 prefoldin subunit 2, putative [Acanthamoeba castellanii str. Neff]